MERRGLGVGFWLAAVAACLAFTAALIAWAKGRGFDGTSIGGGLVMLAVAVVAFRRARRG